MTETATKKGTARYIMIVVFACLANFIIYFTSTAISLFYNAIVADLGIELSGIKLYYTISMFVGVLLGPVVMKKLFPKWGGRKMLVIFGTVGGAAYFALGFCNALWQFYVLGIIVGIGLSSCIGVIATIALNMWFLDKTGLLIGVATSMSGVAGVILSTPLSKIIAANWRNGYFLIGGITLAIVWVSYLFLYRDTPKSCNLPPYGLEKYMEKQQTAAGQKVAVKGLSMANALKTSTLWILIVGFFLYGFLLAFTQSSVGFFMEQGYSITQAAGFLAWLSGSLIVWKLVLGWLADKIGGKWAYITAAGIAFVGFLLQQLIGASVAVVPYIFIICYGCGISSISVLNPVLVREIFGMYEYSAILPIVGMIAGLSNAVCVTLWDVLYGITNSYVGCAWIAASSAIVLIVFLPLAYRSAKGEKFQSLIQEKES